MISFGANPVAGAGSASPYASNGASGSIAGQKTPKEEFLEYARMTPAEKLRESVLRSLGVSEEELKRMDSKERQRIEEQVRELIRQKVESDGSDQKGAIVDVTA